MSQDKDQPAGDGNALNLLHVMQLRQDAIAIGRQARTVLPPSNMNPDKQDAIRLDKRLRKQHVEYRRYLANRPAVQPAQLSARQRKRRRQNARNQG